MKKQRRGLHHTQAVTVIIAVMALCLSGCRSIKYVPVETVHTEYRQADTTAMYNYLLRIFESRREKETRSDSLIDRTNETVVLNAQGDTIRRTRTQYVYASSIRERELETENKMLRDSLSVLNTRLESIQADTVPSIVPVERELSRWEKAKMDFGGMAIGGILIALCIAVIWLVKRFKR